MIFRIVVLLFFLSLFFSQCKQKEEKDEFSFSKTESKSSVKVSATINLLNKGIGPIDSLVLPLELDEAMVSEGKELFAAKCKACHKLGTTFIGPPPNGILERRSPEWVMNMILNPEEMLQKDSVAKALFMEFNGQLMTNQHLTVSEARSILEFFRTLDK